MLPQRSWTPNRYWAEFFGTFMLVFAGTGVVVVNDLYNGVITHPGIAIVWGLVVMTVIYAIGHISGAHINPAVTIAFTAAKKFDESQVLPYLVSQILGALAASTLLGALFQGDTVYGATIPAGSDMQSFILEVVLTWFLMLVILGVTSGSEIQGAFAGIAIGGTVLLEAMFAGPVCGASMNPARSIGPAIVSGELSTLWIYLAAPTLGALIAVFTNWLIQPEASKETPESV